MIACSGRGSPVSSRARLAARRCALLLGMTAATVLLGTASASAQSEGSIGGAIGGSTGGSTGGSIGGSTGGSTGGSYRAPALARPAYRPAVVQRPRYVRPEPRVRRTAREEGRGSGAFDGTWSLSTNSFCAGSGSGSFRVSGTRLSSFNARGSVSPSGAVYATDRVGGMSNTYTGRLSGSSGGGSYRRSDGCTGQWSASR